MVVVLQCYPQSGKGNTTHLLSGAELLGTRFIGALGRCGRCLSSIVLEEVAIVQHFGQVLYEGYDLREERLEEGERNVER